MKPQWGNLHKSIYQHADLVGVFIENVTDAKTLKNLNKLANSYNKVLALTDEFGKLVEPIAPREVTLPFDTPEFAEEWTFYKEYLMEQHGSYASSRTQIKMLRSLKKWSNGSPDKAIEILDFLTINRYKKFFQPTAEQIAGKDLPPEEQDKRGSINLDIDKSIRF